MQQNAMSSVCKKVKFSHTRYRALGPELIPELGPVLVTTNNYPYYNSQHPLLY